MKQNIEKKLEILKIKIKNIIEYIILNKKIISIISIIILIMLIAFVAVNYYGKRQLEMEKNTDISNAIPAIVIKDNTKIYKKPKETTFSMFSLLKRGTNAYILEETTDSKNNKWYKVKWEDRVGYVLQDSLGYFKTSNEEIVLMSDVSKFNVIYKQFKTTKDYQLFLIENNFQYVYIRAGGRGYGVEGNFYTDPNYQLFIDACEYLKIPYGFYYIDEALNSEEIDEEVEFMENFIKENATSMCMLPLTIDIEKHESKARTDDVWEDRVYLAEELVQKFRTRGISTIIYSNAKMANEYLSNVNANFWVAYYPEENEIPNYWYSDTDQEPTENIEFMNKIIGWQFSETGVKDVIKQKVDVNLVKNNFFKQYLQQ